MLPHAAPAPVPATPAPQLPYGHAHYAHGQADAAHPVPYTYPQSHGYAAVAPDASATRRGFRFNASVLSAGLLALLCVGIAGVFAGEVMKHSRSIKRQTRASQAAAAQLAALDYQPDGSVAKEDRARYDQLMGELGNPEHLARMNETRRTEAGIGIGALLAFAGFGFMAVRAGRSR